MDLYLSKLIPLFIYPLGFALLMSVLAMGILGLSARLARLFLFVAVTVLWVTSTPILRTSLAAIPTAIKEYSGIAYYWGKGWIVV